MDIAEVEREVIDKVINRIKERAENAEIRAAVSEAIRQNDELWAKRMLLLMAIAMLAIFAIIGII
ncbi:hypothetical protein FACS1894126_1100 [Alphaproteobacteria bacterium]|nr:hypothetical protein FACS1894126_1100 [Alphaproteobacteria bacterium]